MEGEGPIYADHCTIPPSQEDQHAMHAVQEKVLFISQLVYSWIEKNNSLINKVHLTPLFRVVMREKTEVTVLVPNSAD